jgi:hypothetical protein
VENAVWKGGEIVEWLATNLCGILGYQPFVIVSVGDN